MQPFSALIEFGLSMSLGGFYHALLLDPTKLCSWGLDWVCFALLGLCFSILQLWVANGYQFES